MKKLITAVAAAALMMFSVVPAFAASVNSPVAPPAPRTSGGDPISPKTGTDDTALYAIIGISALACGSAAFALVKTSKK